MNIKDFIQNIAKETKFYIEKYEQFKELSGKQKKARVDEVITDYIECTIDNVILNPITRFILKRVLIQNVTVITQCIFDLMASRVQGITK